MMFERVRKELDRKENLVWILVYDFSDVRENSGNVRKFYRELKKLEGGRRRTNSELVFDDFEQALLVKELASGCGAEVMLYGGLEIYSDFSSE